jgi:adenosylcobinamide kinase/adenosylcobinamide-phosphate guanylyltransferase
VLLVFHFGILCDLCGKKIMDKKIIFITGGARSGKSDFALKLAQGLAGPKAYLATAQALDKEMAERIQKHKRNRPRDWQTLEEPLQIAKVIGEQGDHFSVILVDCLTLWISNSMMAKWSLKKLLQEADRLLEACRGMRGTVIIVSNEVGLGIVPDNPSARNFRDLSGLIHQKVARQADEVYLLVSGLPLQLKRCRAPSAKSIAYGRKKKS